MSDAFIRAKRPDGSECTIDLVELETALDLDLGGKYFFLPESGKILFRPSEDPFDEPDEEDEDENALRKTLKPIADKYKVSTQALIFRLSYLGYVHL